MSLKDLQMSFRIFPDTLILLWVIGSESILRKICGDGWGRGRVSTFVLTISLLRIVIVKNLPISPIFGFSFPLSWKLNFHHNLSNLEIEDLERLMSYFTCVYLFPFVPDVRAWLLSSL